MNGVIDYINHQPLMGLMLVTALGFLLGRWTVRGLSLGPAGGTLFVALPLGYWGVSLAGLYGGDGATLTIGTLGFVLFIYSVGFEAGPRFFASFTTRDGLKFVAVGVAVNVVAVVVAILYGKLTGLDGVTVAGLLSGALTSAPTYAAASQITMDPAQLAVAFAITYPLGLIGLVLMIQSLPRLLHQELSEGTITEEEVLSRPKKMSAKKGSAREVSRAFLVGAGELVGVPLVQLKLTNRTGAFLTRIMRGDEALVPGRDTKLEEGDRVLAVGRVDELHELGHLLGEEIPDDELTADMPRPRRVQARREAAFGMSLAELNLIGKYQCVITGVERGGQWIEAAGDVVIEANDILEVSGARDNVRKVARLLGRFEPSLDETNIAIYTGGIFIGLLIGSVSVFGFSLGSAAGLLIAGLALGWAGRIGAYSTHVPKAARHLVRDLGILLFISETGLNAGHSLMEGLAAAPGVTLLGAALVAVATVLGSLLIGAKVLRLRPLDAWGSVCGGMTSSAALHALRKTADTNEVTISYAAAYTVASVLATLAGQAVILLMGQ